MGKTERRKIKLRPIRCICGCSIDVNRCWELEDFDYTDSSKTAIYVYCEQCGMQTEVKL